METRIYNGWNAQEINQNLRIYEEIDGEMLSVAEKVKRFKEMTGKGRALFFRYKKFLQRKTDTIGANKSQRKRGVNCHFCEKTDKLIVHHIDFNHKNNEDKNLLTLCENCHVRLHNIFKKVQ